MAEVQFLPTLPAGSFVIVPTDWDGNQATAIVISAEEIENVACAMGWFLDERGGGPYCTALDWICDHADEDFEELDEYLEEDEAADDQAARHDRDSLPDRFE